MARLLLRVHLAYLLALPLLGVACLGEVTRHAGTARLGGWIAASVFLAFQLKYYRLPRRPAAAALAVTIVPAQVVAHVMLFDGGLAEYFVEEAFIELASLSLGLALVMLAYRPSGWGGAAIGVAIAAISVAGFGWPVAESYLRHGVSFRIWGLLGLVLVSGTWMHIRLTGAAARDDLGSPSSRDHRGLLERGIDRLAPSDAEALAPNVSDSLVAGLIVAQCLLWLIVPSIGKAIL